MFKECEHDGNLWVMPMQWSAYIKEQVKKNPEFKTAVHIDVK